MINLKKLEFLHVLTESQKATMPSLSSVLPDSFSKTRTDVISLGAYFSLCFPFPEFIRNRQEVANLQMDAKGAARREVKEPDQRFLLFYPPGDGQ